MPVKDESPAGLNQWFQFVDHLNSRMSLALSGETAILAHLVLVDHITLPFLVESIVQRPLLHELTDIDVLVVGRVNPPREAVRVSFCLFQECR
jgi:hypothetical protein